MHVRVTRFIARAEDVERLNTFFKNTVVPAYTSLSGYRGALSCADRARGRFESMTFWETEEEMRASERVANELRSSAKSDFPIREMTVEFCEVGFDEREPARGEPFRAKQPAQATGTGAPPRH